MHKLTTLVIIGFAFALAACGGSEEAEQPTSTPDAAAQELQERVDRLEREAKEREEAAAKAEKAARKRERAARRAERKAKERAAAQEVEDAEPPVTTGGGGITVPNVVGLDHQAAQDALQGEGLYNLDEEDCSGQGRLLLFDRNWEVVSTDPPAGTPVSEDDKITICSVKQGE